MLFVGPHTTEHFLFLTSRLVSHNVISRILIKGQYKHIHTIQARCKREFITLFSNNETPKNVVEEIIEDFPLLILNNIFLFTSVAVMLYIFVFYYIKDTKQQQ